MGNSMPQVSDPSLSSPQGESNEQRSWAMRVKQRYAKGEDLHIHQPPNFTMKFDRSVEQLDEIIISDDEMEEGIQQWRNTLVGCVMGTEVTKENMDKFVAAKWKRVVSPASSKASGVFLFQFHSESDMLQILEGATNFIFDKALVPKRYEPDMALGKGLFRSCPVWVRFPRLGLQFWTPQIVGKLASKLGKTLLADSHTIHKTRLGAPRILIDLHPTEVFPTKVKFRANEETYIQMVDYEWHPRTCAICEKWGHKTEECDPNKRIRGRPNSKEKKERFQLTEAGKDYSGKIDEDGFQQVTRGKKVWQPKPVFEDNIQQGVNHEHPSTEDTILQGVKHTSTEDTIQQGVNHENTSVDQDMATPVSNKFA